MKKRQWIILIILVVIFSLLGLGAYFLYQNLNNNDHYGRGKSNPYFNKDAICGSYDAWECPDGFLEKKGLSGNCLNTWFTNDKSDDSLICGELPEGGEEAGCIEKTMKIYCKDILN